MKIYKDYETLDLLEGKPCIIDSKCTIYPIGIKDYNRFMNYANYILVSKNQLGLKESDCKFLQNLIVTFIASMNNGNINFCDQTTIECMKKVLNDFCELFSILTKKKITNKISNEGEFEFVGEGIVINDSNYGTLREVTLKMTLLKEPKVFEDKLYEQMYYKAMKANRKEGASLSDVVLTVVQDMKYTFEYVYSLNIIQLYGLYLRIAHVKNSDAVTIYRTCSSNLPDVNFTDGVIDDLWKEKDDSDLFADLGDLSNKIK